MPDINSQNNYKSNNNETPSPSVALPEEASKVVSVLGEIEKYTSNLKGQIIEEMNVNGSQEEKSQGSSR